MNKIKFLLDNYKILSEEISELFGIPLLNAGFINCKDIEYDIKGDIIFSMHSNRGSVGGCYIAATNPDKTAITCEYGELKFVKVEPMYPSLVPVILILSIANEIK